jgi:hypothetical protein
MSRWIHSMISLLYGLAAVLSCSGCQSRPVLSHVPSRTVLNAPVRLHFEPSMETLPSVHARVNDGPARLFIIDTGTSGLVLSRRFLSETQPEFLDTSAVMDTPSGVREMGSMCRVARLTMGSAEFHGVTACTADLSNLEFSLNQELGGVIGMGVLSDCQVTLNYPGGDLLLEPVRNANWADGAGKGIVLPLKLSATGLPLVPLTVRGTTVWAVVDSGSDRAFSLPDDFVEQLGRGDAVVDSRSVDSTFHGNSTTRTVQLQDSVFLGPREFLNPVVHVETGEPRIGHPVLRRFIVTIDIRNKRIRFAPAPRA